MLSTRLLSLFSILAAFFTLASVAAADDNNKLRIGITKKVAAEDCPVKSARGDTLKIHYTGLLEDGKIFDSSLLRGIPFEFQLGKGQVIKGWDQGLVGMCVGEQRKLSIPYQLAYGERGAGGVIPPKANLVFKTELIDIISPRDEL